MSDPLASFHPVVRAWFEATFDGPTIAQARGFPKIAAGESTLLLAPTGSGKTLTAFLFAIDLLLFAPRPPDKRARCRVLYVSPLKALAVDVEKNLRAPIEGIVRKARELGVACDPPRVGVRSGDTPAKERARMERDPPDILITTPESLYLVLTSRARAMLASVETVIVDEIHALVPTKRGAHLFLSLERLEALRPKTAKKLQRIGLSATARPLEDVALCLGGGEIEPGGDGAFVPRLVTIVDAGSKRAVDVTIELPETPAPEGDAERPLTPSIWPAIHPRVVELVRANRSTMIFVNSRSLAERLAAAINDEAGEELALAHHGSLAKERRLDVEDRLKRGELRAIVATSSLELGLDLGAVDLVIQIEAPPSVAAGLQRVGRAGHHVGAISRGVVFPKFKGDLLAAAATSERMREGLVEAQTFPRSPLDVLAQHIVAEASQGDVGVEAMFALVRRASSFADLSRKSFESVLDMMSGRFVGPGLEVLRPRLVWDRQHGVLRARDGARRVAVTSGGTIPDRGLFGVFLSGAGEGRSARVGELDEEMVFESRAGDVFLLGATSWRIDAITFDRVLVSPAPGAPGKMPFWRGDRPSRPRELGVAIGALARALEGLDPAEAARALERDHALAARAAEELAGYVAAQRVATGKVPSDRTIVIERHRDEAEGARVVVLTPFGARVHAPWSAEVLARARAQIGASVESMIGDDGIAFRFPELASPPDASLVVPSSDGFEDRLVDALGDTAIFAARFRENATRALLVAKRRPGQRQPLWAQRKRAADLLTAASRIPSFPILLETVREILRDVFDMSGLLQVLRAIEAKEIEVVTVDARVPSPFATSLLFRYVGTFLYDGDQPVAERRAHALAIDPEKLKELLGESDLRDLLDADVAAEVEAELQHTAPDRRARSRDGVHDLLLSLGDLSIDEIAERTTGLDARHVTDELVAEGRALLVRVGAVTRLVAVEDAARYRDALAIELPSGVLRALLAPALDAMNGLVLRFARTHAPFRLERFADRFGLDKGAAKAAIDAAPGLVAGELVPGEPGRAHADPDVLDRVRRRSLAKARKQLAPVAPVAYARFLPAWHGIGEHRAGLDALVASIEMLEGAPLVASAIDAWILPARIRDYRPSDLDRLAAEGELAWVGLESIGANDGRVALFLADHVALLAPTPRPVEGPLARDVRAVLERRGAIFFSDLVAELGRFPTDVLAALWELVWAGEVTNDTLAPLRSRLRGDAEVQRRAQRSPTLARALRRAGPPGSEGRWSLVRRRAASETERRMALARSLLARYGVLVPEAANAEGIDGGFSAIYEVLKAMEQAGRARRGLFVEGLGAMQLAAPGAEEKLRAMRDPSEKPRTIALAATDPANPFGAVLGWPAREGLRLERAAGAVVILRDGELLGFVGRAEKTLATFVDPADDAGATALGAALVDLVRAEGRPTLLFERIDGEPAARAPMAKALLDVGFVETSKGLFLRTPAADVNPRRRPR